ncbi:hypothetical protein ASPZODRAFT_130746 [Penicilliopsis zonata CBS 506.65]|uniref:Epoxide hydrolase N-terminal domain-containing protein n=1 Tax=Penicilliopsis zonata CBS 506.65 TaxID=1073090 RepID=A0A1L9SN40_9EURO|nr:hypothetical protein ASPZODRAFT_130746 [Penicilliopsis zonata CBS 506.65]OJJ48645.1 hypothetical protein ASPZODRAFT_130746 [Penicilliopsis zonata CBS 506.65]
MSLPFSTLPSAVKVHPVPFTVSIPEEEVEEFKILIKLSKIAPHTFESLQMDGRYGVTTDWLITMKEQWLRVFDWRTLEASINTFPQFKTVIEDLSIHFVALFSKKEDAVPIVLLHGWPGSFLEFLPMLQLLREEFTPETLPYHLIVPSLPGYAFSSGPPLDRDFTTSDSARIVNQLMSDLGFGRGYIAQGGDIGSRIARTLGVTYDGCKAIHLNVCNMQRPDGISDESLSASEQKGLERYRGFMESGMGYAIEQRTKPSTIGLALSTNPIALLAWIGEKFVDWVGEPLLTETILDSVSLYWFTNTFSRSIYHYRQKPADFPFHDKPLGYSYYPMELAPFPKSWVETIGNLVFFREHQKGGHFAALERPQDFTNDLVEFIEQVWPGISGNQ